MSSLSVSTHTLMPTHPVRPLLFILSNWLLINVSAITGPWDWRESPVHASLLFMNGSKTGVRLRVFMCRTMACDSNYRHTGWEGGGTGSTLKKRQLERDGKITALWDKTSMCMCVWCIIGNVHLLCVFVFLTSVVEQVLKSSLLIKKYDKTA